MHVHPLAGVTEILRPDGSAPPGEMGEVMLTGLVNYAMPLVRYPIFDTALVSILRKLAGRPISVGGRDHSSYRLASTGLDERQAVWILWLMTVFGSSLGLLIHWMPRTLFPAAAGLMGMFGVYLARLPGYPLPEWAGAWMERRVAREWALGV